MEHHGNTNPEFDNRLPGTIGNGSGLPAAESAAMTL